MIKIAAIVYQPLDQKYSERLDKFIRVPVEDINLIADHGIEGDAKAGHNKKRQVNLLSMDWVNDREAEGYDPTPGQFGEQIRLEGIDVYTLSPGDLLQIGENAVIEVTKLRTGCSRLELVQNDINAKTDSIIGILSTVIHSGKIRVGDPVKIIQPA